MAARSSPDRLSAALRSDTSTCVTTHAVAALMSCEPQILVNNAGGGAVPAALLPRCRRGPLDGLARPEPARADAGHATRPRADAPAGGGAVVNIGSTAGLGFGAARLAGVQRRQGRPHPVHRDPRRRCRKAIRCASIASCRTGSPPSAASRNRALHSLTAVPELVPLETVTDAVVQLHRGRHARRPGAAAGPRAPPRAAGPRAVGGPR